MLHSQSLGDSKFVVPKSERFMRQNVQISPFLTVLLFSTFLLSCKNDNAREEEVADPEAEYFEDYDSPSAKWGFLNTQGEVVIPAKYDQVSGFREGLAPVSFAGRWGYIDTRDSIVIPFAFRSSWQFHDGVARVIDFSGAPCFLFRNGMKVCPPEVAEVFDFSEGIAVFQRGIVFGYMDTSGLVVIDPRFEQAWRFENGFARVMMQGKQGLINRDGDYVIRPEYEKVNSPSSGRILVKQNAQYYFVNMQGDRVGAKYTQATSYYGNIAAVSDENGWRLIDLQEKPITSTRYAHIRPANQNVWIARQVDHLAVLNGQGKELTPFQYAQINNFSEGYAGYLRDDLWGFIDSTGREITPPQFGLVWDFNGGYARAAFQNGIAFVDTAGQVPFIPEYFEMRDFSEGLAPFQE